MKIVSKFYGGMKYKTKLIFLYLCAISLPIFIGLIYIYSTLIDNARQPILDNIHQRLMQEKYNISEAVEVIHMFPKLLSTHTDINRFFSEHDYTDREIMELMTRRVLPTLRWFESNLQFGQQFRFITQKEGLPTQVFWEQGLNFDDFAWFSTAMENMDIRGLHGNGWHFDETCENRNTAHIGDFVFTWYYPLLIYNPQYSTLLEVTISADNLFTSVRYGTFAEDGYSFAITGEQLINTGSMPFEIQQWLSSESAYPYLQGWEPGNGFTQVNGMPFFISTIYMDELDLILGSMVPKEIIDAPLREANQVFYVILVGIVVAILAISYLVATILNRRIKTMLVTVKTIQQGDFTCKIPVLSGDEIDELATEINIMSGRIEELIGELITAENLQKESQLAALQSQIKPHFLFNTLESMKMSAELGETEHLSANLTSLGRIMRYALNSTNRLVSLYDEALNLSYYINIQNLLLDGNLNFQLNIPEEIQKEYQIPSLTLQPIIENSIQHGYRDRLGILQITLSYTLVTQGINLIITDNGSGMDKEKIKKLYQSFDEKQPQHNKIGRNGIGLWNVNYRLVMTYAKSSALQIQQHLSGGLTTIIYLPKQHEFSQ